jgi:hypothetical protein
MTAVATPLGAAGFALDACDTLISEKTKQY